MTQCDVLYRFAAPPTESAAMALARVREVYGIRGLVLDERARTARVEYDATRLSEAVVHQLLRRAGLDILERVSLAPAPDTAAAAPASA